MGNLRAWLEKRPPAQVITGYYLLAVTVSILLFSIPAVHKPGVDMSFSETVFMAISIVSDTGLTVINVAETYSVFGYFVIMIILQFAGIGIMAVSTFFWLVLRRRIGLRERQLIMVDNNQFLLSGLVRLVRDILKIIVVVELVGGVILGFHFLRYFPDWQEAFLQGLFASVCATTNAGMDITGESFAPFAGDYFAQLIIIIQIVIGAIGFPVLIEIKAYLAGKKTERGYPFRFSLFTKFTTVTYGVLLLLGTLAILILEANHSFQGMAWHERLFYALFQSTTTRSAGLTTMDIGDFSRPTLLVLSVFMFIGGSPNSMGGGIRTTTFALSVLFIYNYTKGNRYIKAFNREIHKDDVTRSLAFTLIAIAMCMLSILLIKVSDKQLDLIAIIFEVCSSFGTVGLSLGITPDLSLFAKCILMILMFIGRIGLTSFLLIVGGGDKKTKFDYPKEKMIIG